MQRVRQVLNAVGGDRFGTALARQLGNPQGTFGRVVGRGLVEANDGLNRLVIAQLQVPARGTVLEVGSGPGHAARLVLRDPFVAYVGIDISETMLETARRRNRFAVASGRARFERADAGSLDAEDDLFDAAMGVNVLYFLDDPVATLQELNRVLRRGSRLALGYRERSDAPDDVVHHFESVGHRLYDRDEVEALLYEAGFDDVGSRYEQPNGTCTYATAV